MATLLINDTYIKANSIIDDNVTAKVIIPNIILVQDKWILPLLGSSLFNDLIAKLDADITLATQPDYKDLLDNYLQKTTLWYFLAESVLTMSFKFTNKNVMQKNSDNSVPISANDLLRLRDEFKANAEWYATRTERHLLANPLLFPKYKQIDGNAIEAVIPEVTPYETGMCLDPPLDNRNGRIPFSELYQGKYGFCNPNDNNY